METTATFNTAENQDLQEDTDFHIRTPTPNEVEEIDESPLEDNNNNNNNNTFFMKCNSKLFSLLGKEIEQDSIICSTTHHSGEEAPSENPLSIASRKLLKDLFEEYKSKLDQHGFAEECGDIKIDVNINISFRNNPDDIMLERRKKAELELKQKQQELQNILSTMANFGVLDGAKKPTLPTARDQKVNKNGEQKLNINQTMNGTNESTSKRKRKTSSTKTTKKPKTKQKKQSPKKASSDNDKQDMTTTTTTTAAPKEACKEVRESEILSRVLNLTLKNNTETNGGEQQPQTPCITEYSKNPIVVVVDDNKQTKKGDDKEKQIVGDPMVNLSLDDHFDNIKVNNFMDFSNGSSCGDGHDEEATNLQDIIIAPPAPSSSSTTTTYYSSSSSSLKDDNILEPFGLYYDGSPSDSIDRDFFNDITNRKSKNNKCFSSSSTSSMMMKNTCCFCFFCW